MQLLERIWCRLLGIDSKHQYLYWYRYLGSKTQNFGDILGPWLLQKLSGISVKHIDDRPSWISAKHIPHYLTVGSILSNSRNSSTVWGSGIIDVTMRLNPKAKYLAVRGPLTRERIIALGGDCPEIYGDPALLLPLLYPKPLEKKEEITLIPHYVDYDFLCQTLLNEKSTDIVQMMTDNFDLTLKQIVSSKIIISSSLHGLILAVAYNIPCYWVEFSDKIFGDDVKYYDFFQSLNIRHGLKHQVNDINEFIDNIEQYSPIRADEILLLLRQEQLLSSYPFPITHPLS